MDKIASLEMFLLGTSASSFVSNAFKWLKTELLLDYKHTLGEKNTH